MSLFGTALVAVAVTSAVIVFSLIYQIEQASWRSRHSESAHTVATTVAAKIQRAVDTLALTALSGRDELVADRNHMGAVLTYNPDFREIILVDAEGRLLAQAHQDQPVLANLFTIGQSKWFLGARSGHLYFSSVRMSAADAPYLIVAYPAGAGEVMAARLDLTDLWQVVRDARIGTQGRAFIVNGDGEVIAHTDPSLAIAQLSLLAWPQLSGFESAPNQQWQGDYAAMDGVAMVGASAPVKGTDWIVVTELPQSEAYAASRTALLALGVVLVAVGIGLNVVVSRLLAVLIRKPLDRLRRGAERIGGGELGHRVAVDRPDEIGVVSEAFNQMARRVQTREAELAMQSEALHSSEARYRAIVEGQTELICRWRLDGTLSFVNETYCRYFGRQREDLIGQSFRPLIPEVDRAFLDRIIAGLSSEQPVATLEHQVFLPDGTLRWQQWTNRALFGADGQISEVASVGRDITDRKSAEFRLQALEQYYRSLFEEAPVMYIVTRIGADGPQIVDCNRRFLDALGYEPDRVIGHSLTEFYDPGSGHLLVQGSYSDALKGPLTSQERRLVGRDGRIIQALLWSVPERDENHRPVGTRALYVDITARAKAEVALRESESRLKLALEVARAGAWELDLDSDELVWADETFRLMGQVPGVGQPTLDCWMQSIHPEDLAQVVSALDQSRDFDLHYRVIWPDQTIRWLRVVARVVWNNQQPRALVGLQQDVTERKLAEAALKQSDKRHRRLAFELKELNSQLEERVRDRTAALSLSETRLRRVTDNMSDLVVQVDRQGFYQYVSPSHRITLGYTPETLEGRSLFEDVHPDDLPRVIQMAESVATIGTAFTAHVRIRHAQGHYLWLESLGNPLLDDAGAVVGALIGSRDITARKQAELHAALFSNLGYRLSTATTMEAAADIILQAADELLGWDVAFLDQYDSGHDAMRSILFVDTLEDGRRATLSADNPVYTPTVTTRRVMAEGPVLVLRSGADNVIPGLTYWGDSALYPGSLLFVPLRNGGQFVGLLSIQSYRDQAYAQDDLVTLQALADHCGGALERLRAEAGIRSSLREKEVLLQEIHHRVKNNLQVISSLLSLQSRAVTDPQALEVLRDSQNRVRTMALVHEKLYQSADLALIDLGDYAQGLVQQLWRSYSTGPGQVNLQLDLESHRIGIDTALSCGLILNELVANALKHAFPNQRQGRVRVSLSAGTPGELILAVADDGVGMPAAIDISTSTTLGLQMVAGLVAQINGTIMIERQNGTSVRVAFPAGEQEALR